MKVYDEKQQWSTWMQKQVEYVDCILSLNWEWMSVMLYIIWSRLEIECMLCLTGTIYIYIYGCWNDCKLWMLPI